MFEPLKFDCIYFDIRVFLFGHKEEFDMIFDLSPEETICRKCQGLFSRKTKTNITSLSSADFLPILLWLHIY